MSTYNVIQFFEDGQYEHVRRNVTDMTALIAAKHYCTCISAKMGMTVRVLIVDSDDDSCFFEWKHADGVVHPDQFKGLYKEGKK